MHRNFENPNFPVQFLNLHQNAESEQFLFLLKSGLDHRHPDRVPVLEYCHRWCELFALLQLHKNKLLAVAMEKYCLV